MRVKILLTCLLLCLAYVTIYSQLQIIISTSVINQNGQPMQEASVVQTFTKDLILLPTLKTSGGIRLVFEQKNYVFPFQQSETDINPKLK